MSIEEAYRRWSADLVGFAASVVGPDAAADLVSDAFATVLARGDAAWDVVREPRAYLFRAVANASNMAVRGGRRRRDREQRWVTPAGMSLSEDVLADPAAGRALESLSDRQRAATYLRFWEDLSVEEIAEILQISEGSVKQHLARARMVLGDVLVSEVQS